MIHLAVWASGFDVRYRYETSVVCLFFSKPRNFYNKVRVGSFPQASVPPNHIGGVQPPGLTLPGQGVLSPASGGSIGKWPMKCQEFFPQRATGKATRSLLPLAVQGHGGKMFNIKTSDKVPSGYMFCIKEVALGNSRCTLTRELSSTAPDCYGRPGGKHGRGQGRGRGALDRWLSLGWISQVHFLEFQVSSQNLLVPQWCRLPRHPEG